MVAAQTRYGYLASNTDDVSDTSLPQIPQLASNVDPASDTGVCL